MRPPPDTTPADDPVVDRLVVLITRSLAGGGCANCGGLPHTTTCRVGRLQRAFEAVARGDVIPASGRPQKGDAQ